MKFGAFIMTYNRSNILHNTIAKIKLQTLAPSEILIVDNSDNSETEELVASLDDSSIKYHKVGNNSGPAGAATIGLRMLSEKGYDWVYWGDDDNPPSNNHVFERLLSYDYPKDTGCIGLVGQYFKTCKAEIVRVPDVALEGDGIIEVDNIAGGMTKIVKGQAVREYQIYPEEKLFFGFEELDFDLKLKERGFKLYCPKKEYYKKRKEKGRLNLKKQTSFKTDNMHRNYYSYRNLLFISYRHKMYFGFLYLLLKLFSKSIIGFKFGWSYGIENLKFCSLAFTHFLKGRYGKYF
ncbi:glycosyltransferase [Fulvivirga lutimaris]|uniref:glycosyltransferase n=1 Tax=Fulvivirga lutimaris TaxID=1819566 RepID=UPI0016283FC4|nr:glycosyltransferase [Fulvivirga lutimaris]